MKHEDRKQAREAHTSKSNSAAQQTQIVKPKPDQQETLHQIRRAYYDSITRLAFDLTEIKQKPASSLVWFGAGFTARVYGRSVVMLRTLVWLQKYTQDNAAGANVRTTCTPAKII